MKILITEAQYNLLTEEDDFNYLEKIRDLLYSGQIDSIKLAFDFVENVLGLSKEEFITSEFSFILSFFGWYPWDSRLPFEKQNIVEFLLDDWLSIHNTRIDIFPEEIFRYKHLKELSMYKCLLNEIPKGIKNLNRLETLDLANNRIKVLPNELFELTSLKTLHLSFNKLTSIPKEIQNLQNLTFLGLKGNPISKEEIENLKQLIPNCEVFI